MSTARRESASLLFELTPACIICGVNPTPTQANPKLDAVGVAAAVVRVPKIQRRHHDALGNLKGRQLARFGALEGVHGRGGAEEHEGAGGPHTTR